MNENSLEQCLQKMRAAGITINYTPVEEVADREWDVFDRAIDMHISTLRKKLGDDPKEPRFIKTVRGYGYQLVTPGR